MSNFIPAKRKLFEKTIAGKYLGGTKVDPGYNIGRGGAGLANPKLPELPDIPSPPTIDQAQQNRDQQDRLRRRRGVLANIFGGASKSTLG
jgi:hypothetical protein